MDVTEHKRAEEALKRGQKRFRAMVEKSAEGIVLGTPEKGVIYASPSVERVLGYRPDEFAGRSLYRAVHPDHRQRIADTVAELLADPNNVVIDEGDAVAQRPVVAIESSARCAICCMSPACRPW